MRKTVLMVLVLIFMLCSCNTSKTVSTANNGMVSNTDKTVSAESSESALYICDTIPADNGNEFFYTTGIKIGDRIYSGSENRIISFKEDSSDKQVLYEYPDTDFFFNSLIQFDENTICASFTYEEMDFLPDYKYY